MHYVKRMGKCPRTFVERNRKLQPKKHSERKLSIFCLGDRIFQLTEKVVSKLCQAAGNPAIHPTGDHWIARIQGKQLPDGIKNDSISSCPWD